jgi:hypothetical protein
MIHAGVEAEKNSNVVIIRSWDNLKKMDKLLDELRESGQTDLARRVEYKIEEAQEMGELMGEHLQEIFRKIGFDSGLISTNGAVLFDVDFGNEIEALKRFHPKKMIVTESSEPYAWERRGSESINSGKKLVIETLGKGMNFEYSDRELYHALHVLEEVRKTSDYGLITWLNIWPLAISDDPGIIPRAITVEDFIIKTSKLINPKGLILLSAQEGNNSVEKALLDISNRGIEGHKLEGFTFPGHAGNRFLAVRKTLPEL